MRFTTLVWVASLAQLLVLVSALQSKQPEPYSVRFFKGLSSKHVARKLKKAEIIPNVIDDFLPLFSVRLHFRYRDAFVGQTHKPKYLQEEPRIIMFDWTHRKAFTDHGKKNMTYVVTLTAPDVSSRDNPERSEVCLWIAADVRRDLRENTKIAYEAAFLQLQNIVEYKPPEPPPNTGKHPYLFLVFVAKNETTEPLSLSKPNDRKYWGTGKKGGGVRDWALENGLKPVGANLIYSKDKEK